MGNISCLFVLMTLAENLQTIRENTEIFVKASKDIGLEVNSDKTKYMITSRRQNIVTENLSFENVEKNSDIWE